MYEMSVYDPGRGHALVALYEDAPDEDALSREDVWPVEIYTTRQAAEELLAFIDTQLDVMKVLKIHHLAQLTKPLADIREGLQHVINGVEELKLESEEISF